MSGINIRVVDDEPRILRFLKPALAASDYHVLHAASGREALRLIATASPDLVVLDLGLPDMDGKEVLREARSYYSAPILVLSARDGEAEKIEALDLGADDYVEKPFAIGELLAQLRTALRHRNGGAVETKLVEAGRKAHVPPLPLAGEGRGEGRRPYQHRRRPLSSRRMRSIRPRALRATPRRTARSTESRKRQKGFAFTRCSPSRISHLLLLIDPSCRAIHASSLSESNA